MSFRIEFGGLQPIVMDRKALAVQHLNRFGERQPISDDKPTAVALMRTDDFAPAAFAWRR